MNISELLYSLLAILNEMSPYILLGFIIAGLLHVFVKPSSMSRHLAGRGIGPVVKAAMFGIPLPLCSCGVLPTAVSLKRRGASEAASTSFLIATPQTGVDSIAATYSLLGLPFAILRPVAALVGAVGGGMAVGKWGNRSEASLVDDKESDNENHGGNFFSRLVEAVRYGLVDMVASVGKWLVIGLIVAALITVFVPDTFFLTLNGYPLLSMIAMVAVAVPMYICATGSIPIALSLMLKGLSPGAAFVLLMAGPAANFASVMVLGKTLGKKSTAIYVASVVVTSIFFGLLVDYLMPRSWFVPDAAVFDPCCHTEFPLFPTICSGVLVALLAYTAFFYKKHHHHTHIDMTKEYSIKGMACAHCKATVEKAIGSLQGVESLEVDLKSGKATVEGQVPSELVVEAVRLAGFECELG